MQTPSYNQYHIKIFHCSFLCFSSFFLLLYIFSETNTQPSRACIVFPIEKSRCESGIVCCARREREREKLIPHTSLSVLRQMAINRRLPWVTQHTNMNFFCALYTHTQSPHHTHTHF